MNSLTKKKSQSSFRRWWFKINPIFYPIILFKSMKNEVRWLGLLSSSANSRHFDTPLVILPSVKKLEHLNFECPKFNPFLIMGCWWDWCTATSPASIFAILKYSLFVLHTQKLQCQSKCKSRDGSKVIGRSAVYFVFPSKNVNKQLNFLQTSI